MLGDVQEKVVKVFCPSEMAFFSGSHLKLNEKFLLVGKRSRL